MKRIITCSDGTWNSPGTKDRGQLVQTNVEKMYNCIASAGTDKNNDPVTQVKAYDEGVGSGYTWKDRFGGGITGAGLDKNIRDMYTFICLNYKPGDEIYLFGFSRGAYTARSIAGFIHNCGVLKPEYIHLVGMAYDLYRDRNTYSHPYGDLMRSFRSNYAHEDTTPIKFIGVWDTVGALGIPLPWFSVQNKKKYHFHDVTLNDAVENAYHALAIDDKRKLFHPTLWEKSKKVRADETHPQVLEQRWFAGVHSNIGGGYADCGLSNIALQWLIDKAMNVGLSFGEKPHFKSNPDLDKGELRNSYTMMYWVMPPTWRKVDPNDLLTNQTIDESVWERLNNDSKYKPRNLRSLTKK